MRLPLCICNGVVRSGSTWSFNVCRGLMQALAGQTRRPFGSAYLDLVPLESFIAREWATVTGPACVKTHEIGAAALAAVRSGEAKAICSFRDPRDCVASDMVFMGRGLEFSVDRVMSTLEFLKLYQVTDHILLVRYEQMMKNPRHEIKRMAEHLGIIVDDDTVNRIDARTNLQASRELCSQLKNRPENAVLHIQSHRVDPVTHLHDNHISNAETGRWKRELTVEQGRWLTETFSNWLVQLGYETEQSISRQVSQLGNAAPLSGGLSPHFGTSLSAAIQA